MLINRIASEEQLRRRTVLGIPYELDVLKFVESLGSNLVFKWQGFVGIVFFECLSLSIHPTTKLRISRIVLRDITVAMLFLELEQLVL